MTQLQGEIHQQQRKDRAKDRSRKYHQSQHEELIPKPKGRAGRNGPNGYSLIDKLGLTDNKPRYNAICDKVRALVHKYLDPNLTISRQDQLLVAKVILKAQQNSRTFRKFKDGWPVRDLMGQFLRNRVASTIQKSREKAKKKAKQRGKRAQKSQEADADDPTIHGNSVKRKRNSAESDDEDDGNNDKHHAKPFKRSKVSDFSTSDDSDDSDDLGDLDQANTSRHHQFKHTKGTRKPHTKADSPNQKSTKQTGQLMVDAKPEIAVVAKTVKLKIAKKVTQDALEAAQIWFLCCGKPVFETNLGALPPVPGSTFLSQSATAHPVLLPYDGWEAHRHW
ncbi:hypothetical protein BV22DRAFT_1134962 [Leucogyrophana mollusca]|uniref:Uncharacterized protein n=1 Tax=Leucogyrophana mollusca TaxID=85980 RepID=A0ACB8AY58_9AGAM|nr:hypothetical protein BV22DRAFT_1134962 [Leucogyrophana mollusca]